jgi:oxygen-dependent protoporphyrinogen oxidase
MALLEVMVGGDRDPEALSCSDEELYERAQRACEEALGASGEPSFRQLTRWRPILPQYAPGHSQRIRGAREGLRSIGPIALAGNYLDGVGVEAAAASGIAAVASLL